MYDMIYAMKNGFSGSLVYHENSLSVIIEYQGESNSVDITVHFSVIN